MHYIYSFPYIRLYIIHNYIYYIPFQQIKIIFLIMTGLTHLLSISFMGINGSSKYVLNNFLLDSSPYQTYVSLDP